MENIMNSSWISEGGAKKVDFDEVMSPWGSGRGDVKLDTLFTHWKYDLALSYLFS